MKKRDVIRSVTSDALDAALADGVSVAAKGGFDLANQRLRLDSMTAQVRFASVSASGLVDLA